MQRVVWIEDEAIGDLSQLAAPVFTSGKYDFVIASNASDGISALAKPCAAVIVDIRLPPGTGKDWIELFHHLGDNKVQAKLGLEVLRSVLRPENAAVKLNSPVQWAAPPHFGVLTVERIDEIGKHLNELGINVYRQKIAGSPRTILLELIREIEKAGLR